MSPRTQAPRGRREVAGAQPRLPMSFPPDGVPGRAQPEVCTPCEAAFDGDDWLFSVDWEGSRCLLVAADDGSIHLQGEMAALDERFPEIVAAAALNGTRPAVLDGVICVLDPQGRPDLAGLFARVCAATAARPSVVYLATDLLHLDGESMIARPLHQRLASLRELIPTDSRIQLPDHVAGNGRALADAAAARGLTALIARRDMAPYRAGMASPDRLRIALSARREAVVVGWLSTAAGVRAVLADWADGRLAPVGTAAVEGGAATRWLAGAVEPAVAPPPDEQGFGTAAEVTWVRPRLVATVDPAPGARADVTGLAAWRVVALRDDVNPQWCVRRRAVPPPRAASHQPLRPFSPMVLSALPIEGAA